MRTISQFASRLVGIRYGLTTAVIGLSLLVYLGSWRLERQANGKAHTPPLAATSGFLYVLNECVAPCSSLILGFAVNEATGSLTPLPDFPVQIGGTGTGSLRERLTIDRRNHRLFVINDGSKTIDAFRINPETGKLTAIFTIPLPIIQNGGAWNIIAVQPTCGTLLVVGDVPSNFAGNLASFQITATNATPFGPVNTTAGVVSMSITFSRNGKYVYTGGGFQSKFAGFSVTATGLEALSGSPFESGTESPRAYATDDQGRLFMVNRFFQGQQLRVFTTTNGIPGPTPTLSPTPAGLREAGQGLLHPNAFYLVSDFGTGQDGVGVYKISGSGGTTTLSPVPRSPFHSGGQQIKLLALNHNGEFLFAVNLNLRSITTFSVDTTSGALTNKFTQPPNTLGSHSGLSGIAYLPPLGSPTFVPTTTTTITAPTVRLGTPFISQTAPVTVKVTSECGIPSGEVSLKVDTKTPVSKPLSADGSAAFDIVVRRVPADIGLTADFPAQDGFGPSSKTGTLRVRALVTRPTTTTIRASVTLGQNGSVLVTVTSAAETPEGKVSLTVDGGAAMTKTLSDGKVTFIINRPTPGSHSLEARFTGTAGFASSNAVGTLVVNPPLW